MNSAKTGRCGLHKLFSLTFPDGRLGIGLLLLRVAVGLPAVIKGGAYLFGNENPTLGLRAAACLAVASGILLVLGFLTPVAALMLWVGGISVLLSWLAGGPHDLPAVGPSILFLTVAASVVLLGPGAYSLDARLFGRREIIIPTHTRVLNS